MEEKKWYVLRVVAGKEMKTKSYIDLEVQRNSWTEIIKQILVPTEKVYKIKAGKKVIKERIFFPGYILIEADHLRFKPDMAQTIRQVSGVINFLGANNLPTPLRKAEVNRILGKVDEMEEATGNALEPYLVGENVKIIDGPFNDFPAIIEEVMEDKKKLKVVVKIFGRKTPVELQYFQVEKLS